MGSGSASAASKKAQKKKTNAPANPKNKTNAATPKKRKMKQVLVNVPCDDEDEDEEEVEGSDGLDAVEPSEAIIEGDHVSDGDESDAQIQPLPVEHVDWAVAKGGRDPASRRPVDHQKIIDCFSNIRNIPAIGMVFTTPMQIAIAQYLDAEMSATTWTNSNNTLYRHINTIFIKEAPASTSIPEAEMWAFAVRMHAHPKGGTYDTIFKDAPVAKRRILRGMQDAVKLMIKKRCISIHFFESAYYNQDLKVAYDVFATCYFKTDAMPPALAKELLSKLKINTEKEPYKSALYLSARIREGEKKRDEALKAGVSSYVPQLHHSQSNATEPSGSLEASKSGGVQQPTQRRVNDAPQPGPDAIDYVQSVAPKSFMASTSGNPGQPVQDVVGNLQQPGRTTVSTHQQVNPYAFNDSQQSSSTISHVTGISDVTRQTVPSASLAASDGKAVGDIPGFGVLSGHHTQYQNSTKPFASEQSRVTPGQNVASAAKSSCLQKQDQFGARPLFSGFGTTVQPSSQFGSQVSNPGSSIFSSLKPITGPFSFSTPIKSIDQEIKQTFTSSEKSDNASRVAPMSHSNQSSASSAVRSSGSPGIGGAERFADVMRRTPKPAKRQSISNESRQAFRNRQRFSDEEKDAELGRLAQALSLVDEETRDSAFKSWILRLFLDNGISISDGAQDYITKTFASSLVQQDTCVAQTSAEKTSAEKTSAEKTSAEKKHPHSGSPSTYQPQAQRPRVQSDVSPSVERVNRRVRFADRGGDPRRSAFDDDDSEDLVDIC
ncbi:hypothetical protein QIS74_08654 [Colletotrichum tabaci]|uniref:Uncharacterized protein n=1 Tax=Colletotrichum tabaci TaxID=1209068 RepID=A0AAV9TA89_9PEZI